jgi:hypothetical protein
MAVLMASRVVRICRWTETASLRLVDQYNPRLATMMAASVTPIKGARNLTPKVEAGRWNAGHRMAFPLHATQGNNNQLSRLFQRNS